MPMLKAAEMKVVTGDNPSPFQDEVNRLLSKEWTLHGDLKIISTASTPTGLIYLQALVKLMAFEPPSASPIAQPGVPLIMR